MHRILLINPARNYIPKAERKVCAHPLGLAYLAAAARQKGYEVEILDATLEGYELESPAKNGYIRYGLSKDEMRARIKAFNPDLVGVGCVQSLQLYEAYEVFDIAKSVGKNIVTVFGGAHASALYKKELENNSIDYIVVGEGELSFVNLMGKIKNGLTQGEIIPGVAYKHKGELIYAPGLRIENLDELPFPAYDLLRMLDYNRPGSSPSALANGRFAIIQTSRGCPHSCMHCPVHVVFGKSCRYRGIDNVIDEIKLLISKYGVNEVCIEDSNFTFNRKRVFDFCKRVKEENIKVNFSLPHGIEVDTLDRELLIAMRQAGFYALHLSIESVNETILSTQDKKILPEKVRSAVKEAKELGFKITGYFMVGFPEETLDDVKMTVNFAKSLGLDKVNFFICSPLPGTPLYERCIRERLFVRDFDITHLRYAVANIDTRELNHDFIQKVRVEPWRLLEIS